MKDTSVGEFHRQLYRVLHTQLLHPRHCSSLHSFPLRCRHSLHAIAGQLAPAPECTGIDVLYADRFTLHCFQTLTGTKLLMVVEPDTPDVEDILRTLCVPPPTPHHPPTFLLDPARLNYINP